MYSLTFCVRIMLPNTTVEARSPGCHSNVENAPVDGQSLASSACRSRPAGHSHYVVISWDGRKLVTRIRVMLP